MEFREQDFSLYEHQPQLQKVKSFGKPSPYANGPYAMVFSAEELVDAVPRMAPKKKGKRKGGFLRAFLVVALAVAVFACGVWAAVTYVDQQNQILLDMMNNKISVLERELEQYRQLTAPEITPAPAEGLTPRRIYEQNSAAVVQVICDTGDGAVSTGTGFVISDDGYVLTNSHVVADIPNIRIVTANGTEYAAQLMGEDTVNDLALLKADADELQKVVIGSSDALCVGDQVVAIGYPLGETGDTLTVGYISAKDRIVTAGGFTIRMLQTDAAINSGNSGGPLFNMAGEVVGITTSKYSGLSASGASIEGIGFAIPIDDVLGAVEDLKEYGHVKSSYLGIMAQEVSETVADIYGLPRGVSVKSVNPGESADKAGLQAGDIIIQLGGYDITSSLELTAVLRQLEPGQTTTVTVWRSGVTYSMSIELAERPLDLD